MKKLLTRLRKAVQWIKATPERYKLWRSARYRGKLLIQEQLILERDKLERKKIAAAFNHRYVSGARYDTTRKDKMPGDLGDWGRQMEMGYKWMCPTCNQIHDPLRFSMFTGIIYPKCCEHREESRNDQMEKGFNLKRPIGWCGPDGLFRKFYREGLKTTAEAL